MVEVLDKNDCPFCIACGAQASPFSTEGDNFGMVTLRVGALGFHRAMHQYAALQELVEGLEHLETQGPYSSTPSTARACHARP